MTNGLIHSIAKPVRMSSLVVFGKGLYATTDDGVYFLKKGASQWIAMGAGLPYVSGALFPIGKTLINGTSDGIYTLGVDSTTWMRLDAPGGIQSGFISFATDGKTLYGGTGMAGIWRRPLAEIVTDVSGVYDVRPSAYRLWQNFPNPFNPSTTISFSLLSRSFVSLKIFDVLGKEVAVIVNEELPGGTYTRVWNAGSMPSGVYFYRLHAGSYTETKSLMLLK